MLSMLITVGVGIFFIALVLTVLLGGLCLLLLSFTNFSELFKMFGQRKQFKFKNEKVNRKMFTFNIIEMVIYTILAPILTIALGKELAMIFGGDTESINLSLMTIGKLFLLGGFGIFNACRYRNPTEYLQNFLNKANQEKVRNSDALIIFNNLGSDQYSPNNFSYDYNNYVSKVYSNVVGYRKRKKWSKFIEDFDNLIWANRTYNYKLVGEEYNETYEYKMFKEFIFKLSKLAPLYAISDRHNYEVISELLTFYNEKYSKIFAELNNLYEEYKELNTLDDSDNVNLDLVKLKDTNEQTILNFIDDLGSNFGFTLEYLSELIAYQHFNLITEVKVDKVTNKPLSKVETMHNKLDTISKELATKK